MRSGMIIGGVAVALGILLIVSDLAELTGRAGLPLWLVGLLLVVAGGTFMFLAWRHAQSLRSDSEDDAR